MVDKSLWRPPIVQLDILEEIKITLRKLGVNTLQEFFEKFSEDDLENHSLYIKIEELNALFSLQNKETIS